MAYKLKIEKQALSKLKYLRPKSITRNIDKTIVALAENPEQGKELSGEFVGYFSQDAYNKKYRIIYRFDENTVYVVFIGKRDHTSGHDVYLLFKKFLSGKI